MVDKINPLILILKKELQNCFFSAFFCLRNTEKKVKHRHKSCFIPLSGKKKKYSCNNLAFST